MTDLGPFKGIPDAFIQAINRRLREITGGRTAAAETEAVYRVRATATAAQSISNNSLANPIEFDFHVYAEGGMHSISTNNTRFVAKLRGWYPICGQITFAANATGQRGAQLWKNGTVQVAYTLVSATAAGTAAIPVSTQVFLDAGDWVELRGFQTSGGALNTVEGDGVTYLSIFRHS